MSASEDFRKRLFGLAKNHFSRTDVKQLSKELMQAFLAWGSATEDNSNCTKLVEYGRVSDPDYRPGYTDGLKLKGKNVLLSDILNTAEGIKIPRVVKQAYPDLTEEEWAATLRMTTMILLALEQYKPK